jgi:hypothetical protein
VAGFLISLLVAEASALWAPIAIQAEDHFCRGPGESTWKRLEPGKSFATYAPPGLNSEERRIGLELAGDSRWMAWYSKGDGMGRQEWLGLYRGMGVEIEDLGLDLPALDLETAAIVRISSGWPMICMRATRWETTNPWRVSPVAPTWKGAIVPSAMLGARSRSPVEGVLIGAPVWTGFIFDSAVWGVAAWCVAYGVLEIARIRRRRAGRCIGCGYNLTGLRLGVACPECAQPHSSTD